MLAWHSRSPFDEVMALLAGYQSAPDTGMMAARQMAGIKVGWSGP
jgi:hypothetical protein